MSKSGRNWERSLDGVLEGDSSYNGKIENVESLRNIKDPQMYKAAKQTIARYHSVLGVRTREVKLADLGKGVLGVGNEDGVYLQKKFFNQDKKDFVNSMKEMYKEGYQTKTNKPVAHVLTHELSHALWNSGMTSEKARGAGVEIKKLFDTWSKDKTKKGYGKYARTNRDEFFAETATKAVHGERDKYTDELKRIIKKYKL